MSSSAPTEIHLMRWYPVRYYPTIAHVDTTLGPTSYTPPLGVLQHSCVLWEGVYVRVPHVYILCIEDYLSCVWYRYLCMHMLWVIPWIGTHATTPPEMVYHSVGMVMYTVPIVLGSTLCTCGWMYVV